MLLTRHLATTTTTYYPDNYTNNYTNNYRLLILPQKQQPAQEKRFTKRCMVKMTVCWSLSALAQSMTQKLLWIMPRA